MNGDTLTRDAGLQFERTGLAWFRSGLLALLIAALIGRKAVAMESWLHLASASLLCLLACLFFHVGYRRIHHSMAYSTADASGLRTTPRNVAVLVIIILMIEITANIGRLVVPNG